MRSNSGERPSRGRDEILEGLHMTMENKYTYAIFIDYCPIYSEFYAWNIFSFHWGFAKNN